MGSVPEFSPVFTKLSRHSGLAAWLVGVGVFGAAVVDWQTGQPPSTRIPVAGWPQFVVFVVAVAACVVLTTLASTRPPETGSEHSTAYPMYSLIYGAMAAGAVAVAVADPTYASLILALPLIEIRRRFREPHRLLATLLIIAVIVAFVVTEQTARTLQELEAVFVLSIAIIIVVMLGNALAGADRARSADVATARLTERHQLAQELHDSLGHNLLATSIQLKNATALRASDPERADAAIGLASRAVAEALADTRFAVDTVRADADRFSLGRSLPELAERATPTSITVDLDLDGDHRRLDQLTQITLYRVAQEALSNIVRHADASVAAISSTVTESTATMIIRDDGAGFQPEVTTGRAGLDSMSERLARIGGSLAIDSTPGAGTTLTAQVMVER